MKDDTIPNPGLSPQAMLSFGRPAQLCSKHSAFFEKDGGSGGKRKLFFTRKKVFSSPRNHRFLSKTACFAAAAVLLGGCTLFDPLPPGPAPEGPIVKNAPKRIFDPVTAANYMTTSLSIHLLTNPLEENTVCLDADAETLSHAKMVLEEISRITGTREVPPPCRQILRTRAEPDDVWHFQLLADGKVLWDSRLSLRERPVNSR